MFSARAKAISSAPKLSQAQEVADYQAIGVRCREALLAFIAAAQTAIPWTLEQKKPKRADLNAWAEYICSSALAGASHEYRRHLFKALLEIRELAHSQQVFTLA